jgi:hypothetical protein
VDTEKTKHSRPIETATLPQYMYSEEMASRFREAVMLDAKSVTRPSPSEEVHDAEQCEWVADSFEYFQEHKRALEEEFFGELSVRIGEGTASTFINAISNKWYYDHNSYLAQRIKAGIREYLRSFGAPGWDVDTTIADRRVTLPDPMFEAVHIDALLKTTYQMLYRHIAAWNDTRPEAWRQSRETVFVRRGIALKEPFGRDAKYKEWSYLNAYSLAVSVPEKFASSSLGYPIAAVVTADLDYFNHCILFFAPFIQGMPADQLEVAIIPGLTPEPLEYQGTRGGGIYDYYLGSHRSYAGANVLSGSRGRGHQFARDFQPTLEQQLQMPAGCEDADI